MACPVVQKFLVCRRKSGRFLRQPFAGRDALAGAFGSPGDRVAEPKEPVHFFARDFLPQATVDACQPSGSVTG